LGKETVFPLSWPEPAPSFFLEQVAFISLQKKLDGCGNFKAGASTIPVPQSGFVE
jgi:hypothetical protein